MHFCSDCNSVEQGFDYEPDDENEEIPICRVCGMDDTRRFFDEDSFKDD